MKLVLIIVPFGKLENAKGGESMIGTIRGSFWFLAILLFITLKFETPGAQCAAARKGFMDLNSASNAGGTVYFSDDFESGPGSWILECDWGLAGTGRCGPGHSLSESPIGNYQPGDCSATLEHSIDLSAATSPVLTFWIKGYTALCGGWLEVEQSIDGGTTYPIILASICLMQGQRQETWFPYQCDLTKSSNVKVRFHFISYDASEGYYIDDVEIKEKDQTRLPFPLADDFEGGLDNWIVSGCDWGLADTSRCGPGHSLSESPIGNYQSNMNCVADLTHPIDLAAATSPVLTFWIKGRIAQCGAYLDVQESVDGGTTYPYSLAVLCLLQDTWSLYQLDLPQKSNNVKIRLRFFSYDGVPVSDGYFIDDVEIKEKDQTRLPFPLADDFEGGLDNWIVSGRDWGLADTTPVACTSYRFTHSLTDSPPEDYIPNSNCSAILAHPIDLGGAAAPVLRFSHKGSLTIYDDDYACVDVSTDGGSNWSPIQSWQGVFDRSGCLDPVEIALPKSNNVKIRFRLISDSNASVADGWYIDYVRICEESDPTGFDNEERSTIPLVLELDQNHPNPFNPSTTIRYCLPDKSGIRLEVYDVSGKRIVCLVDSRQEKGVYTAEWNGKDERGTAVGSGVYFYRLTVGKQTISRKMVLLR
jgi:hypothetical protein